MKILNLYAGIGGNRKLWGDEHEITAVEYEPYIADVYKELFPNDTVIVADAHQYLLDHFKEFDFIWSSPPCPTHSRTNMFLAGKGLYRYPDMRLYEEILFLQHFYYGNWVVENVMPYYKPLIQPSGIIARHFIWSNKPFLMSMQHEKRFALESAGIGKLSDFHGIKLPPDTKNKRKLLRNAVQPEMGLYVFEKVTGLQASSL